MSTSTRELRTGHLKAGEASLPLIKMEVTGAITGLLHNTRICQTFLNDHEVPLEAVYMHPLPPRASVHGFRLVVGERVVEGLVRERGAARRAYAQAVAKGHRAALMEQERSDIFTTTVGNIAPGEQVSISFELSGPLEFLESTASLCFPLVVPEVYIAGNPLGGIDAGDGIAADTDRVPDASRITPPRLTPGASNPVDLRLSFTVDPAGLELEKVDSLRHFARTQRKEDGSFLVSLLPGVERLDSDFVIRLKLREGSLQTTLMHDAQSGTFALTVVPPVLVGGTCPPRDLVIVLDRSGSMQGWSLTAARRAVLRMVESLRPQDRFALLAFDHGVEALDGELVPASLRHQQRAAEFLSGIDARGGTDASAALQQALSLLGGESRADKTILFITDGEVGDDSSLVLRASSGVRISTVGIGRHSRAGVLESMAQASGGLCSLVPDESTLEEALRNLHQRLGRPHWMGVSLEGLSIQHQAPRFWDVWEGVPTTFFGQAQNLKEVVSVEGWLASHGHFSQQVRVVRREDRVIYRSWARARLQDLDDLWTIGMVEAHELVALSIEAQVLCRFTAFTAIDSSQIVDRAEKRKTVVQPVEPTSSHGSGWLFDAQADPAASPFQTPCPSMREMVDRAIQNDFADDVWVDEDDDFYELDSPEYIPPEPSISLLARLGEGLGTALGMVVFGAVHGAGQVVRAIKAPAARTSSPEDEPTRRAPTPPDSVWKRLLDWLDSLAEASPAARLERLAEIEEMLAAECRKASAASPQELEGKKLMSLLLDLREALESGQQWTEPSDRLRAALEARDRAG